MKIAPKLIYLGLLGVVALFAGVWLGTGGQEDWQRERAAGDWNTSGGMSDKLLLTVAYEPAGSRFKIALRNQSEDTLTLRVERRRYHGHIFISRSGGQAVEYWDSEFRQLLLTSIWPVPVQSLPPKAEITWQLPVSQLRNLYDAELDPHTLRGATVHTVLEEVAVVPAHGSHIGNNARQISKPIKISTNP